MSSESKQIKIPAVFMRGGTSKGVFFVADDLPSDPALRDAVLLRVLGSPDPYDKQIDGMGCATSSTSKIVILSKSEQPGCDVDYLFGRISVTTPQVFWSTNCGNLTSAVGPFAISSGLVSAPLDGVATVNIWQANVKKKIVSHVQVKDGEVQELGDFELDGVAFPAAEIKLDFLDPGADDGAMLPTGNLVDTLTVPGEGEIEATLINAGNPTVFISAAAIGLKGTELQGDINNDPVLLNRLEAIRAQAAIAMGLAKDVQDATLNMPHSPKISFVARSADYTASNGKQVRKENINLLARILSMGKLHHAMTGTGAVAIAAAASLPGTVVSAVLNDTKNGVRFGHPSGSLKVGAEAHKTDKGWVVTKVSMSRTARRLMEGSVLIPIVKAAA
jgi:probable AcnD-accessory protein PrpF